MRDNLSDNYDSDFPKQLLNLGEEKITSLITNSSSAEIELDDRLGHIIL